MLKKNSVDAAPAAALDGIFTLTGHQRTVLKVLLGGQHV